ncbi:hypothetical protein RND81_09G240300 [Saponaria officinalis]|uniref:CCHC-type domain-containing protein n=1 Tax=Saponaria officinalis TaxID=3572 RepID=A0AAW1IQI4_SAPOF
MSNLCKLEFLALDISGKNYISWVLDVEIHLNAASLGKTIIQGNEETLENHSKALIFLRRHLDKSLKAQYLTVKDPFTLWTELKNRYDHQKSVILPRARSEWMRLRLQDFKSVSDLLEKTFSTFHASNIVLQQQYRERRFQKYSELISCLLVAEQNNELLMQNHQTYPTGSTPIPEVNVVVSNRGGKRQGYNFGPKPSINKKKDYQNIHHKRGKKDDSKCHRCGSIGHWANVCRTPKHLVNLYKASIKEKEVVTNFAQYEVPMIDNTHFDLPDFNDNAKPNNNEFDNVDSFINDV